VTYNEAARVALARIVDQRRRALTGSEQRTMRRIRARWRLAERRRRRSRLGIVRPSTETVAS
jgi:hypothetical protein